MNLFGCTPKPEPDPCKGLFCRYINRMFRTRAGVRHVQELRVLRRMSCEGCPACGSIEDHLHEFPDSVEFSPALQDGDVAELSIVVDSTDWETGYADDWHVLASKVTQ